MGDLLIAIVVGIISGVIANYIYDRLKYTQQYLCSAVITAKCPCNECDRLQGHFCR